MLSFLLQRFLQSLLALFSISVLVFIMMYAVGDPVATLLPQNASRKQREEMRRELGLDKPLYIQYFRYINRLFQGDLGHSYYSGQPVAVLLAERAPATLELATASLLISVLIGVPLGMFAGARPRGWLSSA